MSKARDIADLDFNSPDIDGGNIDGATIGATTAAAGTFNTLNITSASTADTVTLARGNNNQNNMLKFTTNNTDDWIVGQRNNSTSNFHIYSYGTNANVFSIARSDGEATFSSNVSLGGNLSVTGDINIDGGTGDTSSQDVTQKFERTSSTGNVLAAKLKFVNSDTNHGDLKFQVKTTASSAESDSYYADALTIKGSTGRIGVGITSPESLVHLYQKGSQEGQLTLSSELNGSEHNAGRIAWNHSSGWDTTITLGTADDHSASFRDELIINKDYVVFNENSNDMDFRVESNSNANAFFIDAGQNTASFGNTVANPASGFSDQHGMGIHLTDGYVQISADSTPLTLGRTSTAGRGEHIIFRNASAQFASIGDYNGVPYIGYTNTNSGGGIIFNGTSVEPTSGGAGRTNGANDLGTSNYRWRNGMFSGVVQAKTFERNWQFLDMQSLDFNTFYPVVLNGGNAQNSSTFELYKYYGNYNPVVNGTTMLGSVSMKMDMSAWSWGGIPVHNLVHHVAHQYRSMLGAVGLVGYYIPVLWLRGGYGYHFTMNSSDITPTIYTSSTSFHTSPYNYNIGPISATTMASKAQYLGTNTITGIVSKSDLTHWS